MLRKCTVKVCLRGMTTVSSLTKLLDVNNNNNKVLPMYFVSTGPSFLGVGRILMWYKCWNESWAFVQVGELSEVYHECVS